MDRGSVEAPSRHSLALVREGAYKYHQDNDEIVIDPLTAILFARGDEYSVSHPFGHGDDCLEIWFDDELQREARPTLRQAGSELGGTVRSRIFPISSGIRHLFSLMARHIELGLASELEVDESALTVLSAVGTIESLASRLEAGRAQTGNGWRAHKKVELAKEILLSDLGRNWSLNEVAALVDASPFHLTRLVHGFAGTTLHRFLTRQRLAVALTRILEGAGNLTELALDLGFSSHSHFSASFKKEYGRTPRDVRNHAKS